MQDSSQLAKLSYRGAYPGKLGYLGWQVGDRRNETSNGSVVINRILSEIK
jgi:hypothetical protein